jgi:lysozyme
LKTSEKGILLIKNFEGLRLKAYQCSSSVWTIGWGTTIINGIKVKSSNIIDKEMAEILFAEDIKIYEDIVNSNIKTSINQNQFDALVSHTYNTGGSETLFELINLNARKKRIRHWFLNRYITSGGNITPGLIRRRKIEADLFFHNTKKEGGIFNFTCYCRNIQNHFLKHFQ